MVPTAEQTIAALVGAWRLFRFDARGHELFDRTEDGFWKSFYCAVLIAPLYAGLIALRMDQAELANPLARIVAIEAIAYVISWVAYPLVMFHLSQAIDRRERYVGYVVAYNWCAAPQIVLMFAVAVVGELEVFPGQFQFGLQVGGLLYVLAVNWFVARTGLRLDAGPAALVVVVDYLLSLLISAIAQAMLGTT